MPMAIDRIANGMSRLSPTTFTTLPTSTPCTVARTTPMNAKTNPIVDVVNPNFASLNSANVVSKPENASVTMKYSDSSKSSVGLRLA